MIAPALRAPQGRARGGGGKAPICRRKQSGVESRWAWSVHLISCLRPPSSSLVATHPLLHTQTRCKCQAQRNRPQLPLRLLAAAPDPTAAAADHKAVDLNMQATQALCPRRVQVARRCARMRADGSPSPCPGPGAGSQQCVGSGSSVWARVCVLQAPPASFPPAASRRFFGAKPACQAAKPPFSFSCSASVY